MKKETKGVIVLGGLTAGGLLLFVLTRKAKAVPPPPAPGLANLYGVVTDAQTGRPIADVKVGLNGMETYTGSDGYYAFTNVEPGEYVAEFAKEGYEYAVF